jgi:hypothetical protein
LSRASSVSTPSAAIDGATAAMVPRVIATSRTASSPIDGSITRPPLMIRSKAAARALGTPASSMAPVTAPARTNWRRFIMVPPRAAACRAAGA